MGRRRETLGGFGALAVIAGRKATGRLVFLSLLSAATEGLGFVLLVPLLAHAGGTAISLPFGLTLPELPLGALLILFVALVILRSVAEVARRLAAQDLQVAVIDGLRMQAVEGLLHARWRWLSGLRKGESEALLITNIDRAGYGVELVARLVRLVLGLFALGLAALAISPAAALTGAAAAALVLLFFTPLRRRARQLGEALSRRHERLHSQLGEMLGALRVIKSYGREDRSASEVERDLAGLRQIERAYVRDSALGHAALNMGAAMVAAGFAWLALDGLAMPLAILLPLAAIFVRTLPLLSELQASWQGWSHELPALEEAISTIRSANEHREDVGPGPALSLSRTIGLRGVSLHHRAERPALGPLDLAIEARQLTVLTGPSGAGKSTLADLAAGLIAPDEGSLHIDDTEITPANRRAWRARVAYVQQEPVLFSGSVRDNLLWAAPDAGEDQMRRALEEASASFVHSLPEGIDCDLGEGGRALSGGERQRIALARALMLDPDLIILDEATSAIDATSEQAIAAAIHAMTERRTVIAIAHRGLLPDIADRVIRLDKGRLAGD